MTSLLCSCCILRICILLLNGSNFLLDLCNRTLSTLYHPFLRILLLHDAAKGLLELDHLRSIAFNWGLHWRFQVRNCLGVRIDKVFSFAVGRAICRYGLGVCANCFFVCTLFGLKSTYVWVVSGDGGVEAIVSGSLFREVVVEMSEIHSLLLNLSLQLSSRLSSGIKFSILRKVLVLLGRIFHCSILFIAD